jgi:hypothetical protein
MFAIVNQVVPHREALPAIDPRENRTAGASRGASVLDFKHQASGIRV